MNTKALLSQVSVFLQKDGNIEFVGEQTELAIYRLALSFFQKDKSDAPIKVNEVPFNSNEFI